MEFPPWNVAGVYRPVRFLNALKQNGFEPIVVTFEMTEYLKLYPQNIDHGLEKLLPDNLITYRIPLDMELIKNESKSKWSKFLSVYFRTTEYFEKAWRKKLAAALPAIIAKHQPKLLFATVPPYSNAVLAKEVSIQYQLPFILDMRDAWAALAVHPVGSYFHFLYRKRLEYNVFKQAHKIISVTPQLINIFKRTHPAVQGEKFKLIYNGFNFSLPAELEVSSKLISDSSDKYHIGYVGFFYFDYGKDKESKKKWWQKKGHRMLQYWPAKEDWLYRSPYFFFKSLQILLKRKPEWKEKIIFHHIGYKQDWLLSMASEFGLKENVVMHGYKSHQEVIELQNSFDLLLATSEKVIGDDHYCLPSKLFTYTLSAKPVLAFVTNGVQRDFILESKLGVICDPDYLENATDQFEQVLAEGYQQKLNRDYLNKFSNENGNRQFVDLVNSICTDLQL
jgi:hypothetical protein